MSDLPRVSLRRFEPGDAAAAHRWFNNPEATKTLMEQRDGFSMEEAEAWVGRHGGEQASTPREAAQGASAVLACVGNDDDLRAVCLGPDGAFAGMAEGALFVDHTTVSAKVTVELAAAVAQIGVTIFGPRREIVAQSVLDTAADEPAVAILGA